MAEDVGDRRSTADDSPCHVQVTVTVTQGARRHRARRPRAPSGTISRALTGLGLGFVAVAVTVIAAITLQHGPTGARRGRGHAPPQSSPTAAVAVAFGYPHRCLTIAISPADPDYASAHVADAPGCERYRGYVNASFHRVGGVWRLVLDEGQLFVPNRLLAPCRGRAACRATTAPSPAGSAADTTPARTDNDHRPLP
jgi:hypothetical protein